MDSKIKFNLDNFLLALADTLDFVEMDLLGITTHHSKRVSYIGVKIAKKLNLSDEEIFDLVGYSILHDNGLSTNSGLINETNYLEQLFQDNTRLRFTSKFAEHCIIGEDNISSFPFLSHHKNVIKYHHEYYDGSGVFGIKGDNIPILSQIISFADTVDSMYKLNQASISQRDQIKEFIKEKRGLLFREDICDIFLDISKHSSFWLDLQDDKVMIDYFQNVLPNFEKEYTYPDILKITNVFTKIVDTKSNFTYSHSSGLTEKCGIMADFYNFDYSEKMQFMIAASLHDIGKLAVSNKILDKNGKLTYEEMEIMKSHVYYTKKALSKIEGFENITKWASNHHEKLNGTGYPYGLSKQHLCFKERLMACLDIYQALTEDRPYRTGLPHTKVIEIMNDMYEKGEIDGSIIQDLDKVFGRN